MDPVTKPKSFKKNIQTKRLNLKLIGKPTFKIAQSLFAKIDSQRNHFKFIGIAKMKTAEEEYDALTSIAGHNSRMDGCEYWLYSHKTGELMGVIGLHGISWHRGYGELGAWIFAEYAHQGYMSEALSAIEDYFFGMGFHKLVWRAETKNIVSCRTARTNGYTKEGIEREARFNNILNRWENHAVFSKLISEWKPKKVKDKK